jgi:hypothetical protein
MGTLKYATNIREHSYSDIRAYWTKRKPLLLLRLVAVLLLRLAERKLPGLLFQEPPRSTRLALGVLQILWQARKFY